MTLNRHPKNMKEANILMPRLLDIGMHTGDPLQMYIPLLTAHQMLNTGAGGQQNEVSSQKIYKEESSVKFLLRD
ncbi:hypothetical protein ILYODFUR_001108 [Ilyodon furcidens]|uniref:Uncharacterized protein n=1 Tax=Ilyodon furcidens TaxID=33524 RepID=A0ABV0UQU3_9TELE